MNLFNTLTRAPEPFKPKTPGVARIYTCGPTVYNYLHAGNYRTYVFEDALKRALKFFGLRVRHVMNITDVGHLASQADDGDDKMELGSAREGKSAWEIARFYERTFLDDIKKLNIDFHPADISPAAVDALAPADILCRATEHIKEQIDLIRRLESKGFLYSTADGVYFDAAKFPDYGLLAGKGNLAGIKSGARVEFNREKRSACDFAVWKFSPAEKKRQMEWDSPWGRGFPGWHIECSAMAMKYLGESFDIHCGGVDHIPIHHANEIAQSEGATGKPFVQIWMHGEFLLMNKAKMAKSDGGFIRLADLEARGFDPLDFRYFCYTAHYRKQLDFSWEAMESAKTARRRLRDAATQLRAAAGSLAAKPACAEIVENFSRALADDLNLPEAMASVWDAVRQDGIPAASRLAFLERAEEALALGLLSGAAKADPLPPNIQRLFDEYVKQRRNKNYAASDELRRELLDKHSVHVFETKAGAKWERI
ncbi:MAG: cysteine--tRNA ligase [Elusimicrobiota bacterium]